MNGIGVLTMTLTTVLGGVELPADRFHPPLRAFVTERLAEVEKIPEERRRALDRLASWVAKRQAEHKGADLTFICTHNSRRSHISQLWAQVAAEVFGVSGIRTFSGGTEATAFNPRAVEAMRRAGFVIDAPEAAENPRYRVTYGPKGPTMEAFSKVFGDDANPAQGFAAVMTCSQADAGCPYVPGAAYRVAVPYEDPKAFDGTAQEAEMYDARVKQIATEMLYLFAAVHGALKKN